MHIGIFIVTGLGVGLGHCLGMCGPIVISLSINIQSGKTTRPLLLYNLGRVTMYTILGGLSGMMGSFTLMTSGAIVFQQIVMIAVGLLIAISGVGMLGWKQGVICDQSDSRFQGVFRMLLGRLAKPRSTISYYPVGLILGLLPCGPVYTALIASARIGMETKHALSGLFQGALIMLAFGIGTIPALFTIGKLTGTCYIRYKNSFYQLSAIIIIALGIYYVVRGINF